MRVRYLPILAMLLAGMGGEAHAACEDGMAMLKTALKGDAAGIVQAFKTVQQAGCSDSQISRARSVSSAAIARAAKAAFDAGRIDEAETIVKQAPGQHWAVQAVMGDIAAKRHDRKEAAKLYNAAIDTMVDPALTPQSLELKPNLDRLIALAQENMMLAGTLDATMTRGDKPRGVLGLVARGIVVEPVAQAAQPAAAAQSTATQTYDASTQGAAAAPAYDNNAAAAKPASAPAYDNNTAAAAPAYNTAATAAPAAYVPEPPKKVFLPIQFAFDSDKLDKVGNDAAEQVAAFLKSYPVAAVTVDGHTDDVGSDGYNLDLSKRRAQTLAAFLKKSGVKGNIKAVGFGKTRPPEVQDRSVYSLEEFRTISRRVEFEFAY